MNVRTQIKKNAKRALSNYWAKAVAVFLLMLTIGMFFMIMHGILDMAAGISGFLDIYQTGGNYIDDLPNISIFSITMAGLFSLGMILVMIPLRLGIKRWYYLLSEGYSDDLLSIFHFFSSGKLLIRSLALELQLTVRTLFWIIVFFAPAIACGVGAWHFTQQTMLVMAPLYATLLVILSFLFLVAGGLGLLIVINKYFLAKYYILSEEVSAYRAIKQSCRATKGIRGQILSFHLSFIGWIALGILILPLVFVQPYYSMSSVFYARYLMESARRKTMPIQENPESSTQKSTIQEEAVMQESQPEEPAKDTSPQWPVNQEYNGEGKSVAQEPEKSETGFILVDQPKDKK